MEIKTKTTVVTKTVIEYKHITTTKTTTNTQFTLKVQGGAKLIPGPDGPAVDLDDGEKHMEITPAQAGCLADLEKCPNGFTISTKLRFKHFEEGAHYVSTGGENDKDYGISILFQFQKLHVSCQVYRHVFVKNIQLVVNGRCVLLCLWHCAT